MRLHQNQPILWGRLSADESLPWLFKELLKTRIVPKRVPCPAILQIVNGYAVIDAVHCARRFEKACNQRDGELLLSDTRVDQCEIAVHQGTVDRIFPVWFEFDRALSLPDRVVFSPHKAVQPTEIRVSIGAFRRLFHSRFKGGSWEFECLLSIHIIALCKINAAFEKASRRRAGAQVLELIKRQSLQNFFGLRIIAFQHRDIPSTGSDSAIGIVTSWDVIEE